jgi:hypothetical protein
MSQTSNADVLQTFKRVYGDLTNLLPDEMPLAKYIPFSEKQKVGEKYVEAAVLTNEVGWTLSDSTDAFELNPAIAGTIKQTEVVPYISVLPSVIPWAVMSRSAGGGDRAFLDNTKFVVRNNLRSHSRLQEILRLYGRSPGLLGYVSYASQVYRGVAFTNGSGTLPDTRFGSLTFSNGINVANKCILFKPGDFAAGIWLGLEGVKLHQVNNNGAIVASGKLVAVDSAYGILKVDFVPVAASAVSGSGSVRICFDGQQNGGKEYFGIEYILTRTGNLFGIDNTIYSLWSANQYNCQNQKLSLPKFQEAVANAVNKGGLEGDLDVWVNPRTWSTISTTEAGLRVYDSSYKKDVDQGFESVTYYTQAGKATFRPHRCIKEGIAIALHSPSWSRSGSAEVSFQVPGIAQDVIFPLPNQAGYCMRSYSDQYIFNHEPAKQIYFYNINDEAAS